MNTRRPNNSTTSQTTYTLMHLVLKYFIIKFTFNHSISKPIKAIVKVNTINMLNQLFFFVIPNDRRSTHAGECQAFEWSEQCRHLNYFFMTSNHIKLRYVLFYYIISLTNVLKYIFIMQVRQCTMLIRFLRRLNELRRITQKINILVY